MASFREDLEDAAKLLCYQLLYYLVKCIPPRQAEKKLLLVKTDEIGDYVLIRNFLGKFRESQRFGDYHITFMGSGIYRDIYESYDSTVADEAIWLDKIRFRRSLAYRFAILKRLRRAGFSDAVNLVYSRSFRVDDQMIAVTGAGLKAGMATEHPPVSKLERLLTPKHIYNRLTDPGEQFMFEAYKNARYIGGLLQKPIEPVSILIDGVPDDAGLSVPSPYFVVFPGAGDKRKRWPAENFREVANFLADTYGLRTVVCGSGGDKVEAENFIRVFGRPVTDLTGKTKLTEFLAILKHAKCLISVDTGAVHLGAAVRCPVFGLYSGVYFGRFGPYPTELAPDFTAIYPDIIDEQVRNNRMPDANSIPPDLIRTISPGKVIDSIKKKLCGVG